MGRELTIFQVGDEPGFVVVSGEVDIHTASDLHGSLYRAVDVAAEAAHAVVNVDLSAVSFIDARGLTALASAGTYAREREVRLLYIAVPPGITRLLRITGLNLRGAEDFTQHPFRS